MRNQSSSFGGNSDKMSDEEFPSPQPFPDQGPPIDMPIIEQKESIKIEKNTKGYNFKFNILSLDVEELDRVHNAIVEKIKGWEKKEE